MCHQVTYTSSPAKVKICHCSLKQNTFPLFTLVAERPQQVTSKCYLMNFFMVVLLSRCHPSSVWKDCVHTEKWDMWWGEVGEETSEGLALTSVHRRTAPCGPGKIGMSRPVLLRTKMAPSTHTCTTHGWWPRYSLFLPSLVPAGRPDPALPTQGTWVRGLRWEGVKAGVFSSTRRPFANIHQVVYTRGRCAGEARLLGKEGKQHDTVSRSGWVRKACFGDYRGSGAFSRIHMQCALLNPLFCSVLS